MKISDLAVRRPITTCMIFLAIMTLGIVSYRQLPVQLIPDITFPHIGIYAGFDRSAAEIEEKLTKPMEGIVAEMPNVKSIRANVWSGGTWMSVEFKYGTDIQYALVDLEERLASFRNTLDDRRVFINAYPASTSDWQRTFMYVSVRGKADEESLYSTATEKIEQQLKSIGGVANVEIYGNTVQSAEIMMNTDLLAAYQLDFGTVISRVQSAVSQDSFLGRVQAPNETFYVRLNDRVRTLQELANLYIDGKGVVRLRDVAKIAYGESVDRWINRADGKNSIWVRLERDASYNLIALAQKTRERIEEINEKMSDDVEIVIEEDFAKYVEDALNQVRQLALMGAGLALLVPLLFFRSLRVSLIVFLSVPISLISVFNLFYAAGMSINIFSIVGLALGVGMLVDNSIVVVENSFRLYYKGHPPAEAAMLGGSDVGRGLLAATLTTVVVFVPLAFLDGEFKLIVKEPTLGLIFPLMMSLLVALTLVPVFTWLVLRTKSRKEGSIKKRPMPLLKPYGRILRAALRYRGRVILLIALAVTFTWLESCQRMRSATTSEQTEREFLEFYYEAPRGSTLSEVNRRVIPLEDRLAEHPDVESYSVAFNRDGGEARLRLKDKEDREDEASWEEIRATILDFVGPMPGLEFSLYRQTREVQDPPLNLGPEGQMSLKGLDRDSIQAYASRLIDALTVHPQITSARLDERRGEMLYLAGVDREKTQLFNVNARTLSQYVGATRSGGTVSSLQLVDGDDRTDVLFTMEEAEGKTLEEVKAMEVFSPRGGGVPFGELTRFQASTEPRHLYRRDRQVGMDLKYFYEKDTDVQKLTEDMKKIIAAVPNPGGVVTEFQGEARRLEDREEQFLFTLLWGAVLVWVVMAAVFESFWVPFTILATNPLMLMGIVWGLDFAGMAFDDLAAFGVILLIGLAVNNGIVMMDRALTLQRNGFTRTRAIYEASLTRLRPIMMTYMTTVLGLLPMALVGEVDDQWRPVAVVVIGGLTSATILTLLVLPCFYLIGDDFVRWIRPTGMNLLRAFFEVPEAIAALLFHPIKVFRRQIPFAPVTRGIIGSGFRLGIEWGRTPLKAVAFLPADLFHVFFRRTRPAPEKPGILYKLWRVFTWPIRFGFWLFLVLPFRGLWWLLKLVHRLPLIRRIHLRRREAVLDEAPAVAEKPPAPVGLSNVQVIYGGSPVQVVAGMLPRLGKERQPRGQVHALQGVTFEMETGLFGLLGPNGAGKTTMLRCIAGLQEPTRGSVRLFGVSHREAPGMLAPLIGYLPQLHGHYEWMTLAQYLEYFVTLTSQTVTRARALSAGRGQIGEHLSQLASLETAEERFAAIHRAAEEVNLSHVLHDRLGTFSGGMKQRAGIARILLQAPPILIVDEPTAGLDPVERIRVRVLLSRLAAERLVIFSTHIVEDLEHGCDRLAVLDGGRVVFFGGVEDLRSQWSGKLWDVPVAEGTTIGETRQDLERRGVRIVSEWQDNGKTGIRVVSGISPGSDSRLIVPNLEETLIALLGRNPGASGRDPALP